MPETQTAVPDPQTIKEKLLADIRAGEESPETLGKRWGLNGHDLVKNLEQLRKEGFIHVKMKDERLQRVRPTESAHMSAVSARLHVEDDGFLDRLAGGINALKWLPNGWREWDRDVVKTRTGLTNSQVSIGLDKLRESGRLQQLGGGGRGIRIQGVRWRGEKPPIVTEQGVPADAAVAAPKAPSGPSQAVRDTAAYLRSYGFKHPEQPIGIRFPAVTSMLSRWKNLDAARTALRAADREDLAAQVESSEAYQMLRHSAKELQDLLDMAEGGIDSARAGVQDS